MRSKIDFKSLNRDSLNRLPQLLSHWIPRGKVIGHEYVALNPTRCDSSLGSFKVNLRTGKWADFATGDRGGDVVSLLAYITGENQIEAAKRLQRFVR